MTKNNLKGVLYMKKRIEATPAAGLRHGAGNAPGGAGLGGAGGRRCEVRTTFNLRAEADTESKKITSIAKGTTLQLMEYGEDWCRVRIGESGYMGYAKRKWLTSGVIYPSASEAVAASLAATPAPEAADVTLTELTPEAALAESTPEATAEPTPDADRDGGECAYHNAGAARVGAHRGGGDASLMQTMIPVNVGTSTALATGSDLNVSTATDMLGDMPFFTGRAAAEEDFAMQGWAVLQGSLRVMDETGMGNTLRAGDIVFVKPSTRGGRLDMAYRQSLVDLDASLAEYTETVPWQVALAGHVIGGYSQFFSVEETDAATVQNLTQAVHRMGVTLQPGETFDFREMVGPFTEENGFDTSADAAEGICQAATLLYQAAQSLPFRVTEHYTHGEAGAAYAPQGMDASVEGTANLRFTNTLPYAVMIEASVRPESGVALVRFICMETMDMDQLAQWDPATK